MTEMRTQKLKFVRVCVSVCGVLNKWMRVADDGWSSDQNVDEGWIEDVINWKRFDTTAAYRCANAVPRISFSRGTFTQKQRKALAWLCHRIDLWVREGKQERELMGSSFPALLLRLKKKSFGELLLSNRLTNEKHKGIAWFLSTASTMLNYVLRSPAGTLLSVSFPFISSLPSEWEFLYFLLSLWWCAISSIDWFFFIFLSFQVSKKTSYTSYSPRKYIRGFRKSFAQYLYVPISNFVLTRQFENNLPWIVLVLGSYNWMWKLLLFNWNARAPDRS